MRVEVRTAPAYQNVRAAPVGGDACIRYCFRWSGKSWQTLADVISEVVGLAGFGSRHEGLKILRREAYGFESRPRH